MELEKEELTIVKQEFCDHAKWRPYTLRRFDILRGFELVETKCINCHKLLVLDINKIGSVHGLPNQMNLKE